MNYKPQATSHIYPSRAPVFSSNQRIWPFHTVRSVGKAGSAFTGRISCQLALQKDDYLLCNLDSRLFWSAKSLIARKDRGSARAEAIRPYNYKP
jgi:hypothetical protein